MDEGVGEGRLGFPNGEGRCRGGRLGRLGKGAGRGVGMYSGTMHVHLIICSLFCHSVVQNKAVIH